MQIATNISSLTSQRNLEGTNNSISKNLERLSSGLRINKAADDAAGLAISEKMRGQIKGLNQAGRNAQDGISLIQTAEGSLNETHAMLQRMRELAVQSSNDTNTDTDRGQLQKEFNQLTKEINRVATDTEFNTQKLLNGDKSDPTKAATFKFQIGANKGQELQLDINNMDAKSLGLTTDITDDTKTISISTQGGASTAIATLDTAIDTVSTERANLGANQNRLEHTVNNLSTASENMTAAESRIRDVDMAKEMSDFTKNQILNQAGTAMLAQANQRTQGIMSLLR